MNRIIFNTGRAIIAHLDRNSRLQLGDRKKRQHKRKNQDTDIFQHNNLL